MKRIGPASLTVCLAAAGCIATAGLALYCRTLYSGAATKARRTFSLKHGELAGRLSRLEAREPGDFAAVSVWAAISTTDQAPGRRFSFEPGTIATNGQQYLIGEGKGASLHPELRLPFTSTNVHEFDIRVEPHFGTVVDVWLIQAEPCDGLAAFQQFRLHPTGTNSLKLVAQANPGVSVNMDFTFMVLRERIELR